MPIKKDCQKTENGYRMSDIKLQKHGLAIMGKQDKKDQNCI
jgi:hypothetical protein